MDELIERMRAIWCDYTHGGGKVKRDEQGRINWQCSQCGRWSTPVSKSGEELVIAKEIAAALRAQTTIAGDE